ncbi:MAG: hypothetical protein R6X08_02030 [Desulfosalsimonadaceae bacterium]
MKKFGSILLFLAAFLMCIPAGGSAMTPEEFSKMYESMEKIDIGGAVRTQYNYKDWSDPQDDKIGDFGFDTFRFNLDGEIGDMILSAEYRFYPEYDFDCPHHGWVGYNFNENWQGQVGIHQVPFGIQPYASHNFWFSGAYYLGLEDDYDMGIKALYNNGPWDLAFAFYKNGELGAPGDPDRYSIDLLTNDDYNSNNEETNQGNVRAAYTFTHSDTCSTELGVSAQYSQIYNSQTKDEGDHYAGAVHMVGNYGNWNIQLEAIQYEYDPENQEGVNDELMYVGGYSSTWAIPSEAFVGTANIAYSLPVDIGPISSLTFYSDNTAIEPDENDWDTVWQNVVGCLIAAGPVYTYVDVISGENMPFMGGSMVDDIDGWMSSEDRNTRLNINIGYYF